MKMKNLFVFLLIGVLSIGLILYSSPYASANIILTGRGGPTITLGNNGDIYTDISTGHYYLKNNAAWTSISSATAQALLNTPPASLQGYSSTQGHCPGMMDSQGYCTSSQGGILTSSNYFTHSNNGPNISSCTPNATNAYNCVQSSTLTNSVQPNTGANIFCSTGLLNSQGYCMNSQGGIVPPSYSSSNSFCSTGMINSQGYCVNSQGMITTANLGASPDYLSRQTVTNSPSNLNPQVYLSNEAVTRMQPANSLQGAISSYGYMTPQNASNSQAGIIPSNSSMQNSTGANIYSCTQGTVTQQGFLCTQGLLNSEGGRLNAPSFSTQSNSTTSYSCGTGIMNSQGLCVNPQGAIMTPSYLKSQNASSSSSSSPQVYLNNKGVTRSQPSNSLQGTITGYANSTNSSPNVYSCSQGTITPQGFLCTQGTVSAQGGILSQNPNSNSSGSSSMTNSTQGMASQGGILGSQSNSTSGLQNSTSTSSIPVAITQGAGTGGQNGACVIANNCFNPSVLMVSPGDTVTWTNNDNVSHTITSGKPTDPQVGTMFDKSISPGQKVSIMFNDTGTINYFCKLHPWIKGQVVVGMPSNMGSNATSGTTSSGTTSSGTTSSGTTSSGTTSPGTTSPGTTSPGTTSPGTTSPGY